jgi:hypothetical protein
MIDDDDAVWLSVAVLPHQRVKGSDTGVPSGRPAIPPPISAHDGLRPQGPLGSIRFLGRATKGPTAILEPQPTLGSAHAAWAACKQRTSPSRRP